MTEAVQSVLPVISEEQVQRYRADGFTQIDNLVSGDELVALRNAVQAAVSAETEQNSSENLEGRDAIYATIFNQKVNLWQRVTSVNEV